MTITITFLQGENKLKNQKSLAVLKIRKKRIKKFKKF